jgi:hypothetical protein
MSENLEPCVNCGYRISVNARTCPNCSNFRVECQICWKPVAGADLIGSSWGPAFHRKCLEPHFLVPASLRCPDCGVQLALTSVGEKIQALEQEWGFNVDCPKCGRRDPLLGRSGKCSACHLAAFDSFQNVVVHSTGDSEYFYHAICAPRSKTQPAPPATEKSGKGGGTGCLLVLCIPGVALLALSTAWIYFA